MGIVLSLLSITVVLTVIAFTTYYDGLSIGCGILAVVLGLATLITSVEYNVEEEWVQKDVEIVRTSRVVIIDDGDNIWKYTSHKDYKAIHDSVRFYLLMGTNVYGYTCVDNHKYVANYVDSIR